MIPLIAFLLLQSSPVPGGAESDELAFLDTSFGIEGRVRESLPLLESSWDMDVSSVSGSGFLALPALPRRTEEWDVDFVGGLRAVDWAMFSTRTTIESGANSWHLRIDNSLGAGFYLRGRLEWFWVETFFDWTFGVLDSVDRVSFRTLGMNVGITEKLSDAERMSYFIGFLFNSPTLHHEENGLAVPGDLVPTCGFQGGLRFSRELTETVRGSPKLGFTTELAFRYLPLRFEGEGSVENERFGGAGLAFSIGLFLLF